MHGYKRAFCIVVIWQLFCPTSLSFLFGQPRGAPKQLEFTLTESSNGIHYKIEGADVSADPLRGLGKAVEKYGDDMPVVILIDNRAPIRIVGETVALAGKAGFKNIRTFGVDSTSSKIFEIKFGPWTSTPN